MSNAKFDKSNVQSPLNGRIRYTYFGPYFIVYDVNNW